MLGTNPRAVRITVGSSHALHEVALKRGLGTEYAGLGSISGKTLVPLLSVLTQSRASVISASHIPDSPKTVGYINESFGC